VPTVAATHLVIDLPTLFAVTVFLSATGGLLLLFSWLYDRGTTALALWGVGYLLGALGAALLGSPAFLPNSWSAAGASALLCAAYGMMWNGARSFEGRRVHVLLSMLGAVVWLVALQFQSLYESLPARVALVSATLACYALLSARELWYARDPELLSRWPTLALVTLHAGFLLGRIPFAGAIAMSIAGGGSHGVIVSVMAFEALFATFCLPFLRVAMSKERAELAQRKAALTDPLTGIANRRAFFDLGEPLLSRVAADRRPAALLLFDLDRFKEVNDTAGHQVGDRVLKGFSDLVAAAVRPGDLFGRLGGEEFACLMINASMSEALQTAERLRRDFALMYFTGLTHAPTVSVGVVMVTEVSRTLPALLATADRALYRAKGDGRNRVAPAPLVLIDTSGTDAVRRAGDITKQIGVAAPAPG